MCCFLTFGTPANAPSSSSSGSCKAVRLSSRGSGFVLAASALLTSITRWGMGSVSTCAAAERQQPISTSAALGVSCSGGRGPVLLAASERLAHQHPQGGWRQRAEEPRLLTLRLLARAWQQASVVLLSYQPHAPSEQCKGCSSCQGAAYLLEERHRSRSARALFTQAFRACDCCKVVIRRPKRTSQTSYRNVR